MIANVEKVAKKMYYALKYMNYEDLQDSTKSILIEDTITLNFKVEYKLSGIIACPSFNHYNAIIFNPLGCNIDKGFSANFIYYHDGTSNNGNITQLNPFENWEDIGIPYIVIYKFKG